MNTRLRDNLVSIGDVHNHGSSTGSGAGSRSLGPLTRIDFSTQAAPSTAGRLRRVGAHLQYYGTQLIRITQADAASTEPSPRTLGNTAFKAARGTHGHNSSNLTITASSAASAAVAGGTQGENRIGYYDILAGATQTVHNVTSTKKIAAFLFAVSHFQAPSGGSMKMSIEADGVEMASQTWADGGGDIGPYYLLAVKVKATADIIWVSKFQNNGTSTRRVTVQNAQFNAFAGGTTTDPRAGLAQADLGAA